MGFDLPRFKRPTDQRVLLKQRPRLASWMASDHPDQLRLRGYLDEVSSAMSQHIHHVDGPVAIGLDVGLPTEVNLLHEHDLDNYLFPLAKRIGEGGARIVSVWGTKSHGVASYVNVGPAVPDRSPEPMVRIEVSVSQESVAFKQAIHAAVGGLDPLPPGLVALDVSYVVGPRRNWVNLWKPTIDGLGPLLGDSPNGIPWHPLDGRIVDLALHAVVDPDAGHGVVIGIAARPVGIH